MLELVSAGMSFATIVGYIWTLCALWQYLSQVAPRKDYDYAPVSIGKSFAAWVGIVLIWIPIAQYNNGEQDTLLLAILVLCGVATLGAIFLSLKKQMGWKYGLLGLAVLMQAGLVILFVIAVFIFLMIAGRGSRGRGSSTRRDAERTLRDMGQIQ